jgi:cytoskeletal protein RodZ
MNGSSIVETGETPITVGAELAQARKQRGLSLTELARRTKLSVAMLDAIERNDVKGLPGGIFTRGYLRAYAHEVGCDPEAIVRRYCAAVEEPQPVADAGVPIGGTAERIHVADIDAMDRKWKRTKWVSSAAVVLACGILQFLYQRNEHPTRATVQPAAVDPPSRPQPDGNGSGGSGNTADGSPISEKATTGQSEARANELRLDFQPLGLCWLSAIADGKQRIYRLLNADEQTQIEAQDDVILRVGDAANMRFRINGAAARQLGGTGQAVTIHITRDNYREFLDQ